MKHVLVVAAVAALAVGGTASAERGSGDTASAAPSAPPVAHAAARKRVPRVVGMNHQRAQDYLQSRGFYNLREKDCTGRGRALVWDRNWKVRSQTPRAGKRASTDARITLCSVKYTD